VGTKSGREALILQSPDHFCEDVLNRRRHPRRSAKAPQRRVAGQYRSQTPTTETATSEQAPPSVRRLGVALKWLAGKAAGGVVGAAFIAAATHTLSAVGGWETSLRVGLVTVVPLLAMLQIGPRVTSGFANASPLGKYLLAKFSLIVIIGLLCLPLAFRWTGNPDACYNAFYGGGVGLLVGFIAFTVFARADRRNLDWIANHRLGWRFLYRATASIFITVGVLVGLALV
jgi:hypothetical protein